MGTLRAQIYEEFRQFVWNCLHKKASHCGVVSRSAKWGKGAGADLTKIQPAGIRTKSGGARSIEDGKGPAGSGLSLGVAGVENGGRKDATFLRPPW